VIGIGLGLFVTKCILEKMKGYIKVKSAPNEGSTFKVLIPALTNRDIGEESNSSTRALLLNVKIHYIYLLHS
jgi:K+-sensing histidine kinase KdpD